MNKILLSFLLCVSVSLSWSVAWSADRLPNVVIVMTDDQGYADIGPNGAEGFETPHITRMAEEGRHFTHWNTGQPVCSASRAALLTGCYPNRVGIHGALPPSSRVGLSGDETTMADMFRSKGYATAVFGKWHLGDHQKFLPLQRGFEEYFGIPYSCDMWPKHPTARHFPPLPLIDGNEKVGIVDEPEQRMLTTWLTIKAVDFINRNRERPFFLYVPHPQPHVPLHVSDRFAGKTKRGLYGDVISEIDWSVGEIINAIDTNGLAEDTLILFTSDNGPWLSYGAHAGSAKPFREGKGTAWEGGVREPMVMRWVGRIPAGTVCDEPVMHIDLLPTFAHLIGADLPANRIDGLDVLPIITGKAGAENPHSSYWYYYKQNELHAVASGKWKLVLPHTYQSLDGAQGRDDGMPIPYVLLKTEQALYDLSTDIGETTDVSAEHPDIVARLLKEAEAARTELGDALTQRTGVGNREAGSLSDAEFEEIEAFHWPNGRPPEAQLKRPKGKGKGNVGVKKGDAVKGSPKG